MAKKESKALSFEERLLKLETLAQNMEQNAAPLEELLQNYEEGVKLSQELEAELESARARMTEIKRGKDGKAETTPSQVAVQETLLDDFGQEE